MQVGAAACESSPDDLPSPRRHGGRPSPEPYTVVFECSGNAAGGRDRRIDQLDFAGTSACSWAPGTTSPTPQPQPRGSSSSTRSSAPYNYDADGFASALALLASGAMPLDALVEPVDVFLDELLPVMQRSAAGEVPGKVMVRPRRSGES